MLKENHEKFPDKPALQAEVGNFMQATGSDRAVKNRLLWEGMNRLGIDILNIGEDDIAELRALGADLSQQDRFISANLISKATGQPLLKPYLVKSFRLKSIQRPFRVGFLGLSSRDSFLNLDEVDYVWADPLVTARKWLPELRGKCDFLIVLACMPSKDAVQLAIDNNNIDIVLTGFKYQLGSPPATINKSSVVYAEDEGRTLGELRFQITSEHQVDVKPVNHYLTATVKDDPDMAAIVSRAHSQGAPAQMPPAPAAAPSPAAVANYVGSTHCASCHTKAYDAWAKSSHAHAMEILKTERKEYDAACVGCHVTGFKNPGGFVSLYETPQLADVHCEACHGPGRAHSLNPATVRVLKAGQAICETCHTKAQSPGFKFAAYWEKIKH